MSSADMIIRSQAYGEVIWFGGRVTALTLVSFIFMVRETWALPLAVST